jgi:hypothetical protein
MLTKFDFNGWGIAPYTGIRNGNYSNVHEIPDGANPKLAFYDGEQIVIKTQSEREDYDTAQAAAAEIVFQTAKSTKLKQAENEFIMLFASIPTEANILPTDNSPAIKTKLLDYYAADKVQALEIAVDLINAIHEVEIQGGSWYRLPSEPHVIETVTEPEE